MSPSIDYGLLGRAFDFYVSAGYTPIEVPWAVDDHHVAATLDSCSRTYMSEFAGNAIDPRTEKTLIGSAEQGLLALDPAHGRYVACTPCFRVEPTTDDRYQPWFMKVELFDNTGEDVSGMMLNDAHIFMSAYAKNWLSIVETPIGQDLELNGIEVGSYGFRSHPDYGSWSYGTGLALPRFDVANAVL
jgi:hypothetical protein